MNLLPEYSVTTLDRVHHCDALTLLRALPSGFCDCIVTSPPYNIKWKHPGNGMYKNSSFANKFRSGYENYDDKMPESDYQVWIYNVVKECLRVSRGLVWVNHKLRFRDGIGIHPLQFLTFPLWSEVIWHRAGSMMHNSRRFSQDHEYLFGFGRPHYWDDSLNGNLTVWRINQEVNTPHPAPFPVSLIDPIIRSSCPVDGIVLDPFIGSGTTAVAARNLGRHFIGCDISADYVRIARDRLALPFTLPMFADPQTGA